MSLIQANAHTRTHTQKEKHLDIISLNNENASKYNYLFPKSSTNTTLVLNDTVLELLKFTWHLKEMGSELPSSLQQAGTADTVNINMINKTGSLII